MRGTMGIKKLSKSKYHARYFAGYSAKGKRIYPSKTFPTWTEANQWLTEKLREKHLGQYAEASTLTVEQYITQHLIAKQHKIEESTLYTYKGYLEQYIRHSIGQKKLTQVKPIDVEQWQSELMTRISAQTVITARILLGGAFRRAVQQGLLTRNPVAIAETVTGKRSPKHCLTPVQARAFLAACDGPLGTMLKVMLQTGLRPEEAMGLRWKDLILEGERNILKVNQACLWLIGGKFKFKTPKTKNGIRQIGIQSSLAIELKEHRKAQLEKRMKLAKHYQDYDLVFANAVGNPIKRSPLRDYFKSLLPSLGIPLEMRLYDLRHSFVTLSLIAGVDLKTVSEEAGHASVAFTLDHYGHVLEVMRDAAVDKRAALFSASNQS